MTAERPIRNGERTYAENVRHRLNMASGFLANGDEYGVSRAVEELLDGIRSLLPALDERERQLKAEIERLRSENKELFSMLEKAMEILKPLGEIAKAMQGSKP